MVAEKRLINAFEFREKLNEVIKNRKKAGMSHAELNVAHIVAENCPTVDAVEVVRCKDCKKWVFIPGLDEAPSCMMFCGLHSKAYHTKADDFCSYGERRT